jgi:hypothetical protein
MCPVFVYASEFGQLACGVEWVAKRFVTIFVEAIKVILKIYYFPKPSSLSQAMMQAVSCDNWLFESHLLLSLDFASREGRSFHTLSHVTRHCLSL